MKDPKTIIELNYEADQTTYNKITTMLEVLLDISTFDVDVYDAKNYAKESDFPETIANELLAIKALTDSNQ